MKKKIVSMCAVVALAACAFGGATLAYFTSETGPVTNTFSVGKVAITLDEAEVDVYGVEVPNAERVTANTYKLIPGHEYVKDPTIHVEKGSEPCWLFVQVIDQISDIQADNNIVKKMQENGWTLLDSQAEPGVWYYQTAVDAREAAVDVDVFDGFAIKHNANLAGYEGKTITVKAFAIQEDNLPLKEAAAALGFNVTPDSDEEAGE